MLMELVIETLTGVSFELQVSPAETVMSIKSKIQRAEGIPVSQQHLIWQNDELDDHRRLRDYSIAGGSTIRLVLGMRGGPLNAHRIPPLRLTPIQLAPSAPAILPKFTRLPPARGRILHLTRSTLPALTPLKPLTKISDGPTSLGSSNGISDNRDVTEATEGTRSADSLGASEQTGGPDQLLLETQLRLPPESLASESKDVECSTGVHTKTRHGGNECQSVAATTITSELSSIVEDGRSRLPTTFPENSVAVPSICEKVSQEPSNEQCSRSLSPPPGYPPLLPSRALRHSLNPLDVSPPWRLYDHQRLSALSRSFLVQSPFAVCGSIEQDSDNSPPGTASGRDSQPEATTTLELSGEEYTFPSKTPSAAATLLAGIFSSASDCFGPSCQTNGTERLSQPPYPFHWLRRSPCLAEDNPLPQPFVASAAFWDSDDAEEVDALSGNLFELERSEDDPDDGDDDSVEVKGAYSCSLDDDDSLADLEDYLLYYRTGDLLFGPPSLTTTCPPFSYYSLRDPYPTDLEADFGVYSTRTTGDASIKHHSGPTWHQEYSQLSEKVNDLKKRMRDLRVRRQRREKSKVTGHEAVEVQEEKARDNTVSGVLPSACDTPVNVLSDDVQRGDVPHLPSNAGVSVSSDTNPSESNQATHSQTAADCSIRRVPEKKPSNQHRERRFATVTPPELSVLMQSTNADSCTDTSFPRSSVIATAAKKGETLRASMPSIPESLDSQSRVRRPLSSVTMSSLPSVLLPTAQKSHFNPEVDIPFTTARHSSHSFSNPILRSNRPHTSAIPVRSTTQTHPALKGLSWLPPRSIQLVVNHPSAPVNSSDLFGETPSPTVLRNTPSKKDEPLAPLSPPKPISPTKSGRRKRCSLCLRKTGLVGGYLCRCGRNFCSRHRYAELHACPFDYKAEARRTLIASNPVVTAPKLPKI